MQMLGVNLHGYCVLFWYINTESHILIMVFSMNYMIQVLNEFTHGKQDNVDKTEFKEVLSDFLLGMAAGLKRDPVVILRIDGEDLHEFVNSPTFEPEILSIFSEIALPNGSLKDYIKKAFEKLTVDQGMPPATDPWVMF